MALSVASESTLHCILDSQLHWVVVRSIFWVGGKWIMEIPGESGACRHTLSLPSYAILHSNSRLPGETLNRPGLGEAPAEQPTIVMDINLCGGNDARLEAMERALEGHVA